MDGELAGTEAPRRSIPAGRRADQFIEQAPGPRGSPHIPQAPPVEAGIEDGPVDGPPTANTDSCFSSSTPAQAGQAGACPARVRNSNLWPQPRQAYSNRGMAVIVPQKATVRLNEGPTRLHGMAQS